MALMRQLLQKLRSIWTTLISIVYQILPSLALHRNNSILKKREQRYGELPFDQFDQKYKDWVELSVESLQKSIAGEKDRFRLLNDKLLRVTSISSFVLAIISTVAFSTNLPKFFTSSGGIGLVISLVYFIVATLQSLRALDSTKLYAHGPRWDLQISKLDDASKREELIRALVLLEAINLIKSNQNSATFENARNGLIMLIVSVCVFVAEQLHAFISVSTRSINMCCG